MSEPIQVAVIRTVKAGCEKEFEQALHDFVQRSLALPGQMGVSVIRPVPGSGSREYGIIRKFGSRLRNRDQLMLRAVPLVSFELGDLLCLKLNPWQMP